jgi:hypothetical protein
MDKTLSAQSLRADRGFVLLLFLIFFQARVEGLTTREENDLGLTRVEDRRGTFEAR